MRPSSSRRCRKKGPSKTSSGSLLPRAGIRSSAGSPSPRGRANSPRAWNGPGPPCCWDPLTKPRDGAVATGADGFRVPGSSRASRRPNACPRFPPVWPPPGAGASGVQTFPFLGQTRAPLEHGSERTVDHTHVDAARCGFATLEPRVPRSAGAGPDSLYRSVMQKAVAILPRSPPGIL